MQSLGVLKEWVAIGFLNTNPFFFAKYKNQIWISPIFFPPTYRKNKCFTQSKLYKTKILFNSLQIRVFDYLQCKTTFSS